MTVIPYDTALDVDVSTDSTPAVGSPEWYVRRLLVRLRAQRKACAEFDRVYEGTQPLAFASRKFAQVFGQRYARLPANFMPLVVDAERERMIVQGFRFGEATADKSVWRLWQKNQLDAESQLGHEIALAKGTAFTLVAPGDDGPIITIEDPYEMVVEFAPGNRRVRRAALKSWRDDEGFLLAYLYLPDGLYKYRSTKATREDGSRESVSFRPYPGPDEAFPAPNPLGVVPVVPLPNRPRRDGTGRSEIAPVMGNQNAINKLRFDMLVASEYVAFPQRWATNIDIPVDPDTGQPIAPWKPGVDVIWATRRPTPAEVAEYGDKVPAPTIGQFAQADLAPYITAIEEEVGSMSSISRTPYHYFLGTPTSIPPSGESLKSSEAPLVKKVVAQEVYFGEGWEETMRLALIIAGETSKAKADAETIWGDPETRNEAARTDSVIKQFQVGLLAPEVAMEELGYSSTQIERNAKLLAAQPEPEAPPAADGSTETPVNGGTPVFVPTETGTA